MKINLSRSRNSGWIGWVLLLLVVGVGIALVVFIISWLRGPKVFHNGDGDDVPIEQVEQWPAAPPENRGEFDNVPWNDL